MKHINKIISVVAALTLAAAVPMGSFAQAAQASQTASSRTELTISDAAGLRQLAEDCRIDSYSKDLYVTLTADIELSGDFTPIPVFGGTFDGAGHTISGMDISEDGSYCGLFRYVLRGGLVKDVTVKGHIDIGGTSGYIGGIAGSNSGNITNCSFSGSVKGTEYVGGIAGINEKNGLISGCEAAGAMSGSHYTGGIAGSSTGTILNCSSRCSVNTTASEAKLSIQDIDWDSIMSSEEPASMTDAGGIAGYSDGIIQGCENHGTVGYPHIGYNVGGIVGRQSGFVNNCANYGEIFGRKDVGGIAGQLEPYQSIDFAEDTVQKLLDEMTVLSTKVNKLISDAKGAGSAVNNQVQGLTTQMDNLKNSADDISNRTQDIYNGWTDGVNQITARADEALDGISPALDDFRSGLDLLSQLGSTLSEVFDQLTASGDEMQEAIDSGKDGIDTLSTAVSGVSSALDDIALAADKISSSLGDTDKIQSSVKDMIKALNSANGEVTNITAALTQIGNSCDKLQQWVTGKDFKQLSDGMIELGKAMQDVSSALSRMSRALQKIVGSVNEKELKTAIDEFSSAAADFSSASKHASAAIKAVIITTDKDELSKALAKVKKESESAADSLSDAADHISAASDAISKAVDSDQLSAGLKLMESASKELSYALSDTETALNTITEAYSNISSSNVPTETYNEISAQIKNINDCVNNISAAAGQINDALDEITDQLDAGALQDGIDKIAVAADKLSDAADVVASSSESFNSAADSLSSAIDWLKGASGSASDASAFLSDAGKKFSDGMYKLTNLVKKIGDEPVVEFPAADAEFAAAVDSFSNDFAGITSALSAISSTAQQQSNVLLDDIQAISDEFSNITAILQDLKDKTMSSDDSDSFSTDVSEDDSNSKVGKTASCTNYGGVQGDLNVGGIAGSMAIDFDFDPEDDIASNGDHSLSFSYKVRDIVEDCTNTGEITAKKNYCGGIVGKQDMGVVRTSTQNGKVTSSSGSYAGGIAGYSSSAIRKCISKTTVSASSYVGGIAGQGLILTDNASILDAYDYTERVGAVAGYVDFSDKNAEVLRNSFVDRGVAAIDNISYSGKTVPVDFAKYREIAGAAAVIDVKFMVDGELADTIQVDYGGKLPETDFPEIPVREGCFARWSEFDNDCITFPVVVDAVYTPYVTVIESVEQSEGGFALVLADGLFDDGSTIKVATQSSSVFAPDNNSELRVVKIHSGVADSTATRLRFLKPEGRGNVNVMQFVNGVWKSISFKDNGHYLLVEEPALTNGTGTYCVQLQTMELVPMIIIGACVLVALINIILWTILIKRKHAAGKAAKAAEKQEVSEENEEDSEENEEDSEENEEDFEENEEEPEEKETVDNK